METTIIEHEIRSFLVDQFFNGRTEDLSADGSLLGRAIDSTGVLVLVTFLQDQFAITVDDDEVNPDNLDSLNSLVAYVAAKLRKNNQV
jgi:acyl carrier protein